MSTCVNGHANNDDQRFCGTCGSPLDAAGSIVAASTSGDETSTSSIDQPLPDGHRTNAGEVSVDASTPKRRRRVWPVAVGLLAIAGVIAAVIAFTGGDDVDQLTIKGTSLLLGEFGDSDVEGQWDDCQGTGGYSDFGAGQNVSVVDAEGTLIGSGTTQSLDETLLATIVELDASTDDLGLDSDDPTEAQAELLELLESMAELEVACMVYFEVKVPTSEFYSIEIGQRGELDYSLAEMRERNFYVSFSLGS